MDTSGNNKDNRQDNPANESNCTSEEADKLIKQLPKNDDSENDIKVEEMTSDEPKTFDDVLIHLGEFGRYQKIIYFLLFMPTIFSAMHKMSWVFLGAKVNHRCRLPFESVDDNSNNNKILYHSSTNLSDYYKWDEDNNRFDQCSWIDENKNELPCDNGWIYDRTTFGSSAVMEWNLVCKDAIYRATAQALFMLGVLIGSIGFGWMSDVLGRRPTFFISVIIQIGLGFIAGLVPEYWSFMFARMIIGMTTSGVFLVSYVLAMEMVGPSSRMVAGTLCQYYYTFGFFVMSLVAYFLNHDWHLLQMVLTAPTVLFLSYWWIVPESIRWQISKEKYREARKQIIYVAEKNGCDINEVKESFDRLIEQTKMEKKRKLEDGPPKKYGLSDLIKHPNMCCKSLTLFFNWFVISGTYYGLSLSASNLGGNPYINFFISAAVEIPAYAINLLILNQPKIGRRLALCLPLMVAGLALTITIFVPKEQTVLLITLSMLGKLAITSAYGVVYVFSAEIYPTVIRNVGIGACSTSARVGGILCPYLNMTADYWRPAPLIVYGLLAFSAGTLSLLLPETLNKKLPETIEDGENFGKGEKRCDCISSNKRSNSLPEEQPQIA